MDKDVKNGSDDDDLDFMYGVGAEYFLFGPLSVGASYTNYATDKDDIGTFAVNASLHFL